MAGPFWFRGGWKSEVMVHVVNWEEVDGSEGSSKSQAFEIE